MALNWGGKKWRPAGQPKNTGKINQSIDELLKPLSEKKFKGNIWGSQIMNVEKDNGPAPSPSPTPSVTPSISVSPSVTPTQSVTPTPTPSSSLPAPLIFTQTDSNFTNGNSAACTSSSAATVSNQIIAEINGTTGTSEYTITLSGNQTNRWGVQFKLPIPSGTTWNSGTWTTNLNVTTSNNSFRLDEIHICRVNSSDVSQSTIGSVTGLNLQLNTTGVKTHNITGTSQTPSTGDYVNVVYIFRNTAGTSQNLGITVDKNINSPFT